MELTGLKNNIQKKVQQLNNYNDSRREFVDAVVSLVVQIAALLGLPAFEQPTEEQRNSDKLMNELMRDRLVQIINALQQKQPKKSRKNDKVD